MGERDNSKKDLAELIKAYHTVSSVIEELRDEDLLNPHDCDNILGQLKSGLIEDVLMYARTHMTQDNGKNAIKLASEYTAVKTALERQNLKPEDVREIMGVFFKK
jgi:hypothetical protein